MQLQRYNPVNLAAVILVTASISLATQPASQKSSSDSTSAHSSKKSKASHHSSAKKARRPRGQQAIDGDRIEQIQQALIREHYMSGEPSRKWDDATQQAMRKYQADQGWQSKLVPDSRALIRLGLGPDHDHLLNPESAMTTPPPSRANAKQAHASGSSGRASQSSATASSGALSNGSMPAGTAVGTLPDLSPSR